MAPLLLILTVLAGLGNSMLVDFQLRQAATARWPTVTGIVDHSEMRRSDESDAVRAAVSYSYAVHGKRYQSERVRVYHWMSSDRSHAKRQLAAWEPGNEVQVSYDPAMPFEAVLVPGLEGADLFLWLVVLPFDAALLAGWVWLFARPQPLLQMPRRNPLLVGLGTLGCCSFAAVFGVATTLSLHPSLGFMEALLVTIGAVSAWNALSARRAPEDVEVDEAARRLSYRPAVSQIGGQHPRVERRFDEIQTIDMETVERSEGADYGVRVTLTDGRVEHVLWTTPTRAQAYVEWLNQKLGPRPAAPAPEPDGDWSHG